MKLREWWMAHLPRWSWPFSPFGDKGRESMPDLHDLVNFEQQLHLRVYRVLRERERQEARERDAYRDWERGQYS